MQKFVAAHRLGLVIALSLLVVVIGAAWAFAEEPATQFVPFKARVLEILQKYPQVWEEIQAVKQEYGWSEGEDAPWCPGRRQVGRGGFGRGHLMARNGQRFFEETPHHRGPFWSR